MAHYAVQSFNMTMHGLSQYAADVVPAVLDQLPSAGMIVTGMVVEQVFDCGVLGHLKTCVEKHVFNYEPLEPGLDWTCAEYRAAQREAILFVFPEIEGLTEEHLTRLSLYSAGIGVLPTDPLFLSIFEKAKEQGMTALDLIGARVLVGYEYDDTDPAIQASYAEFRASLKKALKFPLDRMSSDLWKSISKVARPASDLFSRIVTVVTQRVRSGVKDVFLFHHGYYG